MADAQVVHIGENSPEQVAFKLYQIVVSKEGQGITSGFIKEAAQVGRAYVLDTYTECLHAVKGYRDVPKRPS